MYEEPIFKIPMDIMKDVVESVVWKRLKSAGTGGMESEALQVWLLKFGDNRKKFLLVLNLSWTGWPIITHHGIPIKHLCPVV